MYKTFFLFFFCVALVISFSQQEKQDPLQLQEKFRAAEGLFDKAESLSLKSNYPEEEERLYQLALSAYETLIPYLGSEDSLQFIAASRAGLIHYYFDSLENSKKNYALAIALKQNLPGLPDSLLFIPYLNIGGIHYRQNQFDSAFRAYKNAELIQEKYAYPLDESERLYNRLGVMYYETGNYRLAKNYFEKAIGILEAGGKMDLSLLVNYKINIASLHIKLEEYEEAKKIYQSLLPLGQYTNEIFHNLGILHLRQGRPWEGLANFKKVNYGQDKKNIDLFYNFAMAYEGLNKIDSANHYLSKAIAENRSWNASRRNVQYGLILKMEADRLTVQFQFPEALEKYQQAIMQFHVSFNDPNVYENPVEFSGIFSYLNLFNTLTRKAAVFDMWYGQTKDEKHLRAALDAYRSAFALSTYVERTYESDDARLFLNRIKHTVHDRPISISLELFELTRDDIFLEQAYFFDQLNKASALVLNMREIQLKSTLPESSELFSRESSLKNDITRLHLRSSPVVDSNELKKIAEAIRDREIELARIQEKLIDDPRYRERHFSQYIPTTREISKLLDGRTAILSYHLSEAQVMALIITRNKLDYRKIPVDVRFYQVLDSLKIFLQTPKESFVTAPVSTNQLYQSIIAPVLPALGKINRLIIIPDDDLHYLPFEVLRDANNQYLLEKFSVQYQYSTSLLALSTSLKKLNTQVGFAPFVAQSYMDSSGISFGKLPASSEEIRDIKGKTFVNSLADKQNFITYAKHSGIIHLATHASINDADPLRSFIAFSPASKPDEYRLYASEIYNMDLDSTDLVILSACETGTGQLIKGEGLMSLSRAFAYAGCPNIITSLWKAEDKTTAYIGNLLHQYLQKGMTKSEALRQAKLDLLRDEKLDPRFKLPNYWAHLVFIGNYEQDKKSPRWIWIVGTVITALITGFILRNRKKVDKLTS